MKFYSVALVLFILISCKKEVPEVGKKEDSIKIIQSENVVENTPKLNEAEQLKVLNDKIIQTLKSKNYSQFSEYIHPEKGVRFSMYAYLNPENKTFSKADFEKYINTNVKFTWGSKDGTGEPLILPIKDYLAKWVFKRDFTSSIYTFNKFQGHGNSLNNLREIYPKQNFTENYIPGTEKYSDMDWNSLRFVFEEHQGNYYLIAVVNDEWTI